MQRDDKDPVKANQKQAAGSEDLIPFYRVGSSSLERSTFMLTNAWTRYFSIPMNAWNTWDEIIPHLFLGVIPTTEDATKLIKDIPNLQLVLSAVKPFEMVGKQTAEFWAKMGVDHYHLPIPDYTANVTVNNVYTAILLMHDYIEKGLDVYVHCKAGRGRSATIVAAYLAIFACGNKDLAEDATPQQIKDFILKKRKQVALNEKNFNVIKAVKDHHRKLCSANPIDDQTNNNSNNNLSLFHTKIPLADRLNLFFADEKTKRQISELPAFKNLRHYAETKNGSKRAKYISHFLDEILTAKNAQWFIAMSNNKGKLKDLLEARPKVSVPLASRFTTGQPKERLDLVREFKFELEKIVLKTLNCSPAELYAVTGQTELNCECFVDLGSYTYRL